LISQRHFVLSPLHAPRSDSTQLVEMCRIGRYAQGFIDFRLPSVCRTRRATQHGATYSTLFGAPTTIPLRFDGRSTAYQKSVS